MAHQRPRIFLSVGRQKEAKHSEFVHKIEQMVDNAGVEIVRLPNTFENPLEKVFEELRTAHGALVICFERLYAKTAVEFRRASEPGPEFRPFLAPTVWNHMEASLAKAFGLPTLIIAEQGCRVEGVLDPKLNFKIHWMDFDIALLSEKYFRELFLSWLDVVRSGEAKPQLPVTEPASDVRLTDIIRGLTVAEAATLVSAIVGAAAALFYAGWWFGEKFAGS